MLVDDQRATLEGEPGANRHGVVHQRVFEFEEGSDRFVNVDDETNVSLAIAYSHPHGGHIVNQVDALTGQRMVVKHREDQISKYDGQFLGVDLRIKAAVINQLGSYLLFYLIAWVLLRGDRLDLGAQLFVCGFDLWH